jgi:NADPH:quinone reductase-like Zn-dependent oxidoreductase
MKAVYLTEHGGTDKLIYGELPDPVPVGDEILVRVRACGVNFVDIWVRRGLPSFGPASFPHVPGTDVVGEVVGIGSSVRSTVVGARVVLNPGVSCRRCQLCLTGKDNYCAQYQVLGVDLPGGYAQLVKIPEENAVPLPAQIAWEVAACVPVPFVTAWTMLFEKAQLQPGEWVLVHAAGSGVGSAAIQLARLGGAHVITTVGSDDKLEKARALGAQYVINYRQQDFLHEVRRITQKCGVDLVVDHIGQEVWERSILCLKPGGRLVTCGVTSGYEAKMDLRHVFYRQLQIFGNKLGNKASLLQVINLLEQGKIHPVLDRILPLRETPRAHNLLQERRQFGKVVLVPE